MAKKTTPAEPVCAKCARAIGIEHGFVPFDDLCAPCTGKPVRQCAKCELVFASIGTPGCPFCRHWRAVEL